MGRTCTKRVRCIPTSVNLPVWGGVLDWGPLVYYCLMVDFFRVSTIAISLVRFLGINSSSGVNLHIGLPWLVIQKMTPLLQMLKKLFCNWACLIGSCLHQCFRISFQAAISTRIVVCQAPPKLNVLALKWCSHFCVQVNYKMFEQSISHVGYCH